MSQSMPGFLYINRHLLTSHGVSRQPSIPTALARKRGLQADPQTLANPHAHIKRPARLQPAQLSEDLPYGQIGIRRLTFCFRYSPTERQSSSIHNSLPLELNKSGLETFVFLLRQILRTPRFCLRTKSLRSLCKISSSKSQKTPGGLCPSVPTGEE